MTTFQPGTGGFLNPQNIVDSLEIREGMIIADFGCGNGYFTLPLAKKVSEYGKVFALDILPDALETLSSRAKTEGINNIQLKRCNLEKENGSGLLDNSCDMVFLTNLLFQTENDENVVKEAYRILKPGGELIFIDWRPDVALGPKGKRVNPEEIKELMSKEKFSFEKEIPTDKYHFGMIFKKL